MQLNLGNSSQLKLYFLNSATIFCTEALEKKYSCLSLNSFPLSPLLNSSKLNSLLGKLFHNLKVLQLKVLKPGTAVS